MLTPSISLNINRTLTEELSGFIKGLQVDKAVYTFIDELLHALYNKISVDEICCDLAYS